MNPSIKIRLVAAAMSACFLTLAFVGCNKKPPANNNENNDPPEQYTPHTLETVTFTQDDTDYRAMALSTFADLTPALAEDFTYEETQGGIRLLTYTKDAAKLILPSQIEGKPVVSLADELFRDNTTLSALSIPESIVEIGENLLTGCRSLQVLQTPQLGKTRESDGFLAYFFGVDTPVGMGFKVPSSLDTVILLDTVTKIADNAFLDCSRLRMVLLPETMSEIGSFAFSGCSQLHFVPLPASVRSIGDYAFADCTSLITFTIGNSVQSVGLGVLMGCRSLEQITLPFLGESRQAEQAYLGHIFGAQAYTFQGPYIPSALRKVTLTEGNVPDYGFYACDTLAQIELPDACQRIGIRAFWGCYKLQRIALPAALTSIGELAFAHCVVLREIECNQALQEIGIQAFYDCYSLLEITLPDSLTAIPASAFADCRCLTTVSLGTQLTSIGAQAFRNCSSLQTVHGATTSLTIAQGNEALLDCLPVTE